MKTPSTALFDLIKSLTPNEKRYVSVYENLYRGNKNHQELFALLIKEEHYKEEEIKKKLGLFKNNQLAVLKSYLYDLILKAMRNFHSSNSQKNYFQNALSDAYFLFEKRLYNQAIGILNKIEPDLEKLEIWKLLHTAYQLRVNIMASNLYEKTDEASFDTFIDKIVHCENQNANYQSYYLLALRVHYLCVQIESQGENKIERKIQKIQKNSLLKNIDLCTTIKSKYFFYQAISSIEQKLKNEKKSAFWLKKQIAFLLENPQIFNNNDVLSVSQNLFNIYSKSKNRKEIKKIIDFEKEILSNSDTSDNIDLFFRLFVKEIEFIIFSKDINHLKYFIKELEQYQKNHLNTIGYRQFIVIWFKIMYAFYIFEQIKLANEWSLKLLKVLDKKLDSLIIKNLLIIRVILFIESDQNEDAIKTIKTLKRNFKEEDDFLNSFCEYTEVRLSKEKTKKTKNIKKRKMAEMIIQQIKLNDNMLSASFIELWLKKIAHK